jgi:hypothetical protein
MKTVMDKRVDLPAKLNELKGHGTLAAITESEMSNIAFNEKLQGLSPSIQNLADQIKQRWTHPGKFRDIATGLMNILRLMMQGEQVSNTDAELEPFRDNVTRLHDLTWQTFPDGGPQFKRIWEWVRNSLFAKLN